MPESLVLPEVNLVSESSSNAPTRSKVDLSSTMEPSTPASVSSSPRPVRDSSWLQVDLCRDFQRDTCPRGHTCRFAHPQSRTIIVKDGKVTCCYDFLKVCCGTIYHLLHGTRLGLLPLYGHVMWAIVNILVVFLARLNPFD